MLSLIYLGLHFFFWTYSEAKPVALRQVGGAAWTRIPGSGSVGLYNSYMTSRRARGIWLAMWAIGAHISINIKKY